MTYTRDQILNMKPGRELDALVAEKVMGWKLRQVGNGSMDGEYYWHDGSDFVDGRLENLEFSTDISAAWEVVEKSLNGGKRASIYKLPGGTWWGQISDSKAFCETAPEAICKAALLAVMEELPKGSGTTEDAQAQPEAVGLGLGGEQTGD